MRGSEEVWRLGLRFYDAGMMAAERCRPLGAVREQAARLRALAFTATPAVADELRELAEALDAELEAGAWPALAEAEELVGSVWAGDGDEGVLARLASLREDDPEHDRPLGVLAEWVRLRAGRR